MSTSDHGLRMSHRSVTHPCFHRLCDHPQHAHYAVSKVIIALAQSTRDDQHEMHHDNSHVTHNTFRCAAHVVVNQCPRFTFCHSLHIHVQGFTFLFSWQPAIMFDPRCHWKARVRLIWFQSNMWKYKSFQRKWFSPLTFNTQWIVRIDDRSKFPSPSQMHSDPEYSCTPHTHHSAGQLSPQSILKVTLIRLMRRCRVRRLNRSLKTWTRKVASSSRRVECSVDSFNSCTYWLALVLVAFSVDLLTFSSRWHQ